MAGRRGNSEGTITQRADGRWEARVSLPDGKRKSFYGKTRREVERRLSQARRDVADGLPVIDERITLGDYLTTWLEAHKHQVKASSYRRYKNQVHLHIIPELGKIPLAKITAHQIQTFYSLKLDSGVSSTTVHHMHAVLHKAFDDALRLGRVQRNIVDLVKAPRPNEKEMQTFNEEQAQKFLEVVRGDRLEALFVLAITTGLREGEVLVLQWRDVDFEQGRLTVRAGLQEVNYHYEIGSTKSRYSRRTIALPQIALEALRSHRHRQQAEKAKLGDLWDASLDLVFPNQLGRLYRHDDVGQRKFYRLLRDTNLPKIRFHDLRHTFATLMLAKGVHPKVVSEMLGHADIGITLRIYSHVLPHMHQAAADVMNSIFA